MQEGQHNCWSLDPIKPQQSKHALQTRDPTSTVHFCSCFLHSIVEGEINPQLTFSSDETWFHLQRCINTQNNHYWSSQNPHPTHEVLLHPVKVGVRCAVSVRGITGLCFLMKQLITKDVYRPFSGNSFQSYWKKKNSKAGFSKTQLLPTLHVCLCPMCSGTESLAVVFDQHVHPILIIVIFSSGVVWRTEFRTVTPEQN
jgi:hypothetical protein